MKANHEHPESRVSRKGHPPCLELREEDFRFISDLIRSRFGINLTDQKRSLLIGRLQGLLRHMGLPDFRAYRRHLESSGCDQTLGELVNRIATNHTFFFREADHFTFLRETILPHLKARGDQNGNRDLRIWCAAASTGEEPYSILITMLDYFGPEYPRWDAGLLATDISARALEKARLGIYPAEQAKNIPRHILRKYFVRRQDGGLQVASPLRREITFRRFNLMNERFPFRQPFDLIFCRNVMIYFDLSARQALLRRFARFLEPGGYLLIGHSETIGRTNPDFAYIQPAVYRRKE
ncbi:CheR family methyltransferase [Desulfonatronum parangueonense]